MNRYDRALVWFRRDLRAEDNAALSRALDEAGAVYCVFVFDTEILDEIENEVIAFAKQSSEPHVSEVERYVLAENDPWVRGGVS